MEKCEWEYGKMFISPETQLQLESLPKIGADTRRVNDALKTFEPHHYAEFLRNYLIIGITDKK